MNIIVCLDDRDGMLFCGRRQSMDSQLRTQVLNLAGDGKLWMNAYSAGQFTEDAELNVDEAFLNNAPEDAWCFVETDDIVPYLPKLKRVAVYRWNRHYPSDRKFPRSMVEDRWILESTREFSGSSHDLITEEMYRL